MYSAIRFKCPNMGRKLVSSRDAGNPICIVQKLNLS